MTRTTLSLLVCGLFTIAAVARAQDGNAADEKAMKAASARVASSIVKIDTAGGTESIGGGKGPTLLKGTGSTTGLIVAADGYVITSSFNFANKPTDIFVTVPGKKRYPAKVVATDHSRMLTLLRCFEDINANVPATGLPVPTAYPKNEVSVGQWALALGRTLDPDANHPPSMSAGIVSATGRIWGKAIQTDAKVSPTNYGGPLVSIDGRVFGVLVPLSPRGTGETVGLDWYDSGIGFAIPLDDVLARLPALKDGKDLLPGQHGIIAKKPTDQYQAKLEIGSIQPQSAAEKAGLQIDDVVVAIDGQPVPNYSTFRHIMEPKYADDAVAITVKRGDKEMEFKDVRLLGSSTAFTNGFLGVLPLRDDPGPGVPIRFVYSDSPAAKAGLAEGDRIMKIGPAGKGPKTVLRPVANRAALATLLAPLPPGEAIQIELKRKGDGKVETVTATLGVLPGTQPEKLPQPSSAGKALEGQPKKVPFPMEGAEISQRHRMQQTHKHGRHPAEAPKGRPSIAWGGASEARETPGCDAKNTWSPIGATEPRLSPRWGSDSLEPPPPGVPLADSLHPWLLTVAPSGPESVEQPPEKIETGYLERTSTAKDRSYWLFVPENYTPNVSHGLIVWFHPLGQGKDGEQRAQLFRRFCEESHFLVIGPRSVGPDGWVPSETDGVLQDVRAVMGQFTIDKSRVIAHGAGNGGQMAYHVGFNARDLFRGVAVIGAVLGTTPGDNVASQPLEFFIAASDKDPALKQIEASKSILEGKKFPVTFRTVKDVGREALDAKTFEEMKVWMDSLDRL